MEISFTTQIWKEGNTYVAFTPELDVSSCGKTPREARKNLQEAVEILLEETEKMGTINEILEESGFKKEKYNSRIRWSSPKMISIGKEKVAI